MNEEDIEENDMLRNHPHNGHINDPKGVVNEEDIEENDMLRNRPHNGHINDPEGVINEDDEDFETTETVRFNENGDIELDEDDVIDESTMKRWCLQSLEVR